MIRFHGRIQQNKAAIPFASPLVKGGKKGVLLLAMILLAGWAWADTQPAHIVLTGRELQLSPRPVVDDGKVYAPVKVLDYLGCTYSVDERTRAVTITTVEGTKTSISTVALGETDMLPMAKVIQVLDGDAVWQEHSRMLHLLARLKSVEFAEGRLRLNLSLPSAHRLRFWTEPDRLSIDIPGAKLAMTASEVFIGSEAVSRARVAQFDERTVRVVLDLSQRVGYRVVSEPISNRIEIEVGAGVGAVTPPEATQAPPDRPGVLTISSLATESLGDDRLRISISTNGKPNADYQFLNKPLRLCVDISDAILADNVAEISVEHPLVKRIRLGKHTNARPTVRMVIDLNRYLAYSLVSADESGLVLDVRLPQGAGGRLSEKVIVIDPGHGGPQRGASHGGVHEKTLNLQLAKRVARRLQEVGARVILTREGDYNLDSSLSEDLRKRPGVATEFGADLFVSIHCNAGAIPNRRSGTETYYRQFRSDSYALGRSIHDAIIKGTGMNDMGLRSDRQLHGEKGLAVLRFATVPAILVEAGYMDNNSDRKRLVDAGFQEKFAAALVEGLQLYVEGNRLGDTE